MMPVNNIHIPEDLQDRSSKGIAYNYFVRSFLRFFAANAFPADLFNPDLDITRTKKLFKSYVKITELESHSYCNRTCWFCPNSSVDRRSVNIRMDQKVYNKIFENLSDIDYDQALVWSGYNEPLSDESVYENISLARRILPMAYLRVFSNGDYLSAETIHKLQHAGLDQLRVNLYPDQEHDPQALLKNLSQRTGLDIVLNTREYGGLQLKGSPFLISVEVKDYKPLPGKMFSRGGYLLKESGHESFVRTSMCFSPIQHVAISYTGDCMLCCQVRPDIAMHRDAIIGNLNAEEYTLFHYYRDLASAREALLKPGPKPGVCKSCSYNHLGGGPRTVGRYPWLSKVLNNIPLSNAFMDFAWLYPRKDRKRYTDIY